MKIEMMEQQAMANLAAAADGEAGQARRATSNVCGGWTAAPPLAPRPALVL